MRLTNYRASFMYVYICEMALHILDVALLSAHSDASRFSNESHNRDSGETKKEESHPGVDRVLADIPQHLTDFAPSPPRQMSAMRKCLMCTPSAINHRKRTESCYMCSECDAGPCVVPCFKQ
jgi:hypothetical protein